MEDNLKLHAAEHRAYRELYASAQQIITHWSRLADCLAGSGPEQSLRDGVSAAIELTAALDARVAQYGIYGKPAAAGVGHNIGSIRRNVTDRFLERNQALRSALLDAQHLSTLLSYLTRLAQRRDDAVLGTFCQSWREIFAKTEADLWLATVELGDTPDEAIAPLDDSILGKTAQSGAVMVGALGEWIDKRVTQVRNS